MKKNNSVISEKDLEFGKYLEADMIELTKDEVVGGGTPTVVITFIVSFVSDNTCPSSACTRAC